MNSWKFLGLHLLNAEIEDMSHHSLTYCRFLETVIVVDGFLFGSPGHLGPNIYTLVCPGPSVGSAQWLAHGESDEMQLL